MPCLRVTVDATGASELIVNSARTPAEGWIVNGATAIEWSDDSAFVFGAGMPLAANATVGPISVPAGGRIYAATAASTSSVSAYIGGDV